MIRVRLETWNRQTQKNAAIHDTGFTEVKPRTIATNVSWCTMANITVTRIADLSARLSFAQIAAMWMDV